MLLTVRWATWVGIEGARQLPPQRGQRGRALRLAERGFGAALLGDVALDALDAA